MRILIAEDSALVRQGLISVVETAGHQVVAAVADGDALTAELASPAFAVDVAVLDIRMPPTWTDEGVRAAQVIRSMRPGVGVLLISQHVEAHAAVRLISSHPRGFGYLLKDRIAAIDELLDAIERVAAGAFVVDPEVITQLLHRGRNRDALARLTPRERDVLGLVAEGLTNPAIARRLRMSGKTVENHISSLFIKLGLGEDPDEHRRVRAVLILLERS